MEHWLMHGLWYLLGVGTGVLLMCIIDVMFEIGSPRKGRTL